MDALIPRRQELASQRKAGAPFDAAWTIVLNRLPAGESASDTACTLAALTDTSDTWRAAYERRPQTEVGRAAGVVFVVDADTYEPEQVAA